MRSKLAVLILLTLLMFSSFATLSRAQTANLTVEWCKTFGYGAAYSVIQASNGNFLVAMPNKVAEITLEGTVIRNSTVPFSRPKAMIATNDSTIIVAGEKAVYFAEADNSHSIYSIYQYFASLAKMDETGNIVWNQTYYLPGQPIANPAESPVGIGVNCGVFVNFVIQTNDGGFLMGGQYNSGYHLGEVGQSWLIKTDASGNSVWAKTYDIETNSNQYRIASVNCIKGAVETDDGGFLVTGNINGYALTKIDSTGGVEWSRDKTTKDFLQDYSDYNSISRTETGEYLLAGYGLYFNGSEVYVKANLSELDANFTVIWSKTYDDQRFNDFALKYTTSGNYYFSGYQSIIETDHSGNIEWVGNTNGTIYGLIPIATGNYLVVGTAKSDLDSSSSSMNAWVENVYDPAICPSPSPTPSIPEYSSAFAIAAIAIATTAAYAVTAIQKRKTAVPTV